MSTYDSLYATIYELEDQLDESDEIINDLDDDLYQARREIRQLRSELSAERAERAKIWESAYNAGWANRAAKQKDWSTPEPHNPYLPEPPVAAVSTAPGLILLYNKGDMTRSELVSALAQMPEQELYDVDLMNEVAALRVQIASGVTITVGSTC